MLGLYLNTFIIGHKSCNMLSKLTNFCFWAKCKHTTEQNKKIKHKNPCRSRELNPGPLASKADTLPLHQTIYKSKTFTLLLQSKIIECETLMMLGLYIYTLIIGHTSCNMLSILNKLAL